jgi:hypothetical protein
LFASQSGQFTIEYAAEREKRLEAEARLRNG